VDFSDSFGFEFYSMVFLKNSNIEDDIRKLKNKHPRVKTLGNENMPVAC